MRPLGEPTAAAVVTVVVAVALIAAGCGGSSRATGSSKRTSSSRSASTTSTTSTTPSTTPTTTTSSTTVGSPNAPSTAAGTATTVPASGSGAAATVPLPIRFGGFPVTPARGGRYLVDAAGRPFLLRGDAAWSLAVQLDRSDVARYLDDRAARGFNTVLVSLLEHKFSSNAPANLAGDPPFTGDPFTEPNAAYFDHVDWVLGQAERRGILVLLVPAYLGFGEGDEGWYQDMADAGPDRLRSYGRWVAKRFSAHRNVMWVAGGDDNPPDKRLTRAVAEGIEEVDPSAVQTAHAAPDTSALDEWKGERWLDVDTVYPTSSVVGPALAAHRRADGLPFFLVETQYENEHGVTEAFLRAQAYGAILSGATGEVFGNNPIWHFDGPGLYDAPGPWQQQLDSAGSRSMAVLHTVMATVPWWLLEPDTSHRLVTGGPGASAAVAAVAGGARVAVAYLPDGRQVTVDASAVVGAGGRARGSWVDPRSGAVTDVALGAGPTTVTPPGGSGAGHDWLLVVRGA